MNKVITYQHYLNKYKGENPDLTKIDRFKEECRDFVIAMKPNFVAVYRPKKSRINYKNVDKLMQNTISRFDLLDFKGSLDEIYYSVEEDRYKSSMHMNIVGKGKDVNPLQLATAMKRNVSEIGYFDNIRTDTGIAIYVNKHIAKKGINLGLQGYVQKEQAVNEEIYDVLDENLEHPNKQYHLTQKFISKYRYGWNMNSTMY